MKIKGESDLNRLAEIGLKRLRPEIPRLTVGMSSCGLAAGAGAVFDFFRTKQGRKKKFELISSGCAGFCGAEPLVAVTLPGKREALYGPVDKKVAQSLIDSIKTGIFPKENLLDQEHPFYRHQVRLVSRNLGVIDPKSIEEYIASGGYRAFLKTMFHMRSVDVIGEIEKSGLRGRGGAGFPTGRKWEITKHAGSAPRYIIMNGDEGDPGAYMDRSLMEGDPHAIIEGMLIGAYAMGAEMGILYVRAEYPLARARLESAVREAREHGLLGTDILDKGFDFDLHMVSGAGAFVSGEETALIHAVEGNIAEPDPRPPYPSEKGLYGRPTCINNVETWANVPLIIRNGAKEYRRFGTEKSKGTKLFCLAGDVARTGLVEVPLGTPLSTIVQDIGGGAGGGLSVKAIQIGGPSGGCIPESAFDLPADYESLQQAGTIMGSGGLVVMSQRNCMVDIARYFLDFTKEESCGKCTPCREGTELLGAILDRITRGDGKEDDLNQLEQISGSIMATSLCGLGQTAPNPVLTTLKHFRAEYETHVKERRCPAGVCTALLTFSIHEEKCTGCGLCVKECPSDAITGIKKKPHQIDAGACVRCGACRSVCPAGAVAAK